MTDSNAHLERVAQAIWRAHTLAPAAVTFDELALVAQASYRRMAEAAIDILCGDA